MIKHRQKATDGDIYWVAYGMDGARHIAICPKGLSFSTGQPSLEWSYDPDDLLARLEETSIDFTDWREVPEQGEEVKRGLYSYKGKLVMCYQDHTRTEHAIEDIPALFGMARSVLAEWVQPAGAHDAYQTGDEVLFNGSQYRSLIDANVWSPASYPAAWEEV